MKADQVQRLSLALREIKGKCLRFDVSADERLGEIVQIVEEIEKELGPFVPRAKGSAAP